jgi:hypothetical protein
VGHLGGWEFFSFSTLYVCAWKKEGASAEVESRGRLGIVRGEFFGGTAEKKNHAQGKQQATVQLAKNIFSRQRGFSARGKRV